MTSATPRDSGNAVAAELAFKLTQVSSPGGAACINACSRRFRKERRLLDSLRGVGEFVEETGRVESWIERVVEVLPRHGVVAAGALGRRRLRFVNRADEARLLLSYGFATVSVLVGPKGCGKTELARALVRGVEAAGAPVDTVYLGYEVDAQAARTVIEVVSKPLAKSLLELIGRLAGGLEAVGPGAAVARGLVSAADVLAALWRTLHRRPIMVFVDELRSPLEPAARQELELRANDVIRLAADRDVEVKLVYLSSDAVASRLARIVGAKVGWLLAWNLDWIGFVELLSQLEPPYTLEPVLVWQLTGGNPRDLISLALDYGWAVEDYVRSRLALVAETLSSYARSREISEAQLVEEAAKLLETLSQGLPPRLIDALEEANIVLNVSLYRAVSRLPDGEPWAGRRWAFQVPVYYWVLKAVVEEGRLEVEPNTVLAAIRDHLHR